MQQNKLSMQHNKHILFIYLERDEKLTSPATVSAYREAAAGELGVRVLTFHFMKPKGFDFSY